MTIPSFIAAGAGTQNTGSAGTFFTASPAAPATILAGDFLLLHVGAKATTRVDTLTYDSAFTEISNDGLSGALAHSWAYHLCDGSEDSITYACDGTYTGSSPRIAARIYQFRNTVQSASFTEGGGKNNGSSNAPAPSSLTTTGIDRRGIFLTVYNNNSAHASSIGESGGNWVEAVGEYVPTNIGLALETATLAGTPPSTGTTISGGSSLITSTTWRTVTFALIPIVSPSNTPNKSIVIRQAVKRASIY